MKKKFSERLAYKTDALMAFTNGPFAHDSHIQVIPVPRVFDIENSAPT